MEKILKVLKINLLSIIALPLLLVATVSKLIAKALEKLSLIVKMTVLAILVVIAFETIKSPQSALELLAMIVILCVIGFFFVLLLMLMGTLANTFLQIIWYACIAFFESVYGFTYSGFLRLYAICEDDYLYINMNGKAMPDALFCLFFTIVRFVNKLIVTVVSLALPASIALSVLLVGSGLYDLHRHAKQDFGIGLFAYIGKFDTFSMIYGIVSFIALMAIFVVVLIALGIEWHEWALELKMTGEELDENIRELQENDFHVAEDQNSVPELESSQAHMQDLEEHIDGLESLSNMVENVLSAKDNALLRSTWGNYFRNLSEIVDECSKYKNGIPLDKFKKLIPRIQQLEKQRADVKSMAEKLQQENSNPVRTSVFFSGCNTADKLEKRYRSLCKAYHPDAEGGDTETFQKMQDEYEALKATLQDK